MCSIWSLPLTADMMRETRKLPLKVSIAVGVSQSPPRPPRMKRVFFALAALWASAWANSACSPTRPPVWPAVFTVQQHKWSANGNSTVVTYYDHTRGANLIIDDGGDNTTNLM